MEFFACADRRYARFPRLAALPGIAHAYSTTPLDVSARRDEHAALRDANRRTMARDLGLRDERIHYCVQAHATRIACIDADTPAGPLEDYDALVTAVRRAVLMTFSADCPLVLVFDPATPALGMVHSSWRCTTAFSTRNLILEMTRRFGSRPSDLWAGIGPSAGPQRYEVGQDVYEAAAGLPERDTCFPRRDGRMFFDLWRANRLQLLAAGLRDEQIETAGICTMSDERFFSFRRLGPGCGHFGLMAALA
jgi:polyphenol oxidase